MMSPKIDTERQERSQRQMKEHLREQKKLTPRKKVNKRKEKELAERLHKSDSAKSERLEELRMRKKIEDQKRLEQVMSQGLHKKKKKLDEDTQEKMVARLEKPLRTPRAKATPEYIPSPNTESRNFNTSLRGGAPAPGNNEVKCTGVDGTWRQPPPSEVSTLRDIVFGAASRAVKQAADEDEAAASVADRLHQHSTKAFEKKSSPRGKEPPALPQQFFYGRETHLGPGAGQSKHAEPWKPIADRGRLPGPNPKLDPEYLRAAHVVHSTAAASQPLQPMGDSAALAVSFAAKLRAKSAPRERRNVVSAKGFAGRQAEEAQKRKQRMMAREAKATAEAIHKSTWVSTNPHSNQLAKKLEQPAERLYVMPSKRQEQAQDKPLYNSLAGRGTMRPHNVTRHKIDTTGVPESPVAPISDQLASQLMTPPRRVPKTKRVALAQEVSPEPRKLTSEERQKSMERLYHSHIEEKRAAKKEAEESVILEQRKQKRKTRTRPLSEATTERLIDNAKVVAAERRAQQEKADIEFQEAAALQQAAALQPWKTPEELKETISMRVMSPPRRRYVLVVSPTACCCVEHLPAILMMS